MTERARRRWRGPRAVAGELMQEAGEHAARVVATATKTGGRAVVLGVLAGVIVGAGLVWLGVSLSKQLT